jgi:hypothetical protein
MLYFVAKSLKILTQEILIYCILKSIYDLALIHWFNAYTHTQTHTDTSILGRIVKPDLKRLGDKK